MGSLNGVPLAQPFLMMKEGSGPPKVPDGNLVGFLSMKIGSLSVKRFRVISVMTVDGIVLLQQGKAKVLLVAQTWRSL